MKREEKLNDSLRKLFGFFPYNCKNDKYRNSNDIWEEINKEYTIEEIVEAKDKLLKNNP